MWVLSLLGVEVFGLSQVELFVDSFWHVSEPDWNVGLEVFIHCLANSPLSLLGGFPCLILLLLVPIVSSLVLVVFVGREATPLWFLLRCSGSLSAPSGECFFWLASVEWLFYLLVIFFILFLGRLKWLLVMVAAKVLLGCQLYLMFSMIPHSWVLLFNFQYGDAFSLSVEFLHLWLWLNWVVLSWVALV